ncbi:hypothetical protein RC62_3007 [Flavobacterium aquidurense]|uniref:Uncharacterized protein n=1 Tax=Flavobacterium aquidurense TaxID=362413 RepID=A0A0Q0XPN4_9FLAO|nr:hypothetical protein RC62_3007 [Flavobacterium aquidurense]
MIIGKNLFGFQLCLFMILLNLFSSFIVLLVKYYRKRKKRKLDLLEQDFQQ